MEKSKEELIGKLVFDKEGAALGEIKGFLEGNINEKPDLVLVEPNEEIDFSNVYRSNTEGDMILPLENVSKVRDILVLE